MAASAYSYPSNKATHGSSAKEPRPHSPVSGPTSTGHRDHNAVRDMHTRGNTQPPSNSADLGQEIDDLWEQGEKLPAQLPRPS